MWYALVIGSAGALHPFFTVVLARLETPRPVVAALIAAFPVGTFLAGPVWGLVADRAGRATQVLRAASTLAAVAGIALVLAPSWAFMLPACIVLAVARSPLIPIADVLTFDALGEDRADYGRIRLWGSVAFAAAVAAVGSLMAYVDRANLLVSAALLVMAALLSWRMPEPTTVASRDERAGLWDLLRAPGLRALWPICLLHGLGIATYDHLFALRIEELGLPTSVTTRAIAAGITLEVLALAAAPFLLLRAHPATWMLLGVAGSIPRWWFTGTSTDAATLSALQALHGVSYGLWWVGGMPYLASKAPPQLRHSAQSMFIAVTHGASTLVTMAVLGTVLKGADTGPLFTSLTISSIAASVLMLRLRSRKSALVSQAPVALRAP